MHIPPHAYPTTRISHHTHQALSNPAAAPHTHLCSLIKQRVLYCIEQHRAFDVEQGVQQELGVLRDLLLAPPHEDDDDRGEGEEEGEGEEGGDTGPVDGVGVEQQQEKQQQQHTGHDAWSETLQLVLEIVLHALRMWLVVCGYAVYVWICGVCDCIDVWFCHALWCRLHSSLWLM